MNLDIAASPPSLYGRQFEPSSSAVDRTGTGRAAVSCSAARAEAAAAAPGFVPECDRAGRYSRVQCYRSEVSVGHFNTYFAEKLSTFSSAGFLLVCGAQLRAPDPRHEHPERPARLLRPQPHTNSTPVEKMRGRQTVKIVTTIERRLEFNRRTKFLGQLFRWMTLSVGNTTVPYRLDSEPDLTLNQRVAKWQFIALDTNRNGVSVFVWPGEAGGQRKKMKRKAVIFKTSFFSK